MAQGDSLQEDQTLVRYVRKRSLRRDAAMQVIGVNPDAFEHRPGEDYLSATWAEFLSSDGSADFDASIKMFRRCLNVSKTDGYVFGQVGSIKSACLSFSASIRVIHEPDGLNTAHVALRRIPKDNAALRARLAAVEWSGLLIDSDYPRTSE